MSDDTDEFPGRLLHQAALWDNAELLEDLLASDEVAHINSRDSWGRTALHAAATTYGSCCLRVLLQSGADPDIPCGPRGDYRTALHMAAEHGHLSNISLLLEHAADLLVRDHCGLTASDLADQGEHADCMLLLRHEADAREREKLSRHSTLRDACGSGDLTRVKQVIRELGRDAAAVVNMTPDGCSTLLYKASCEGHRAIVKVLVDAGAEGKLHPVTRYSPLYIAVYNGRKDVVEVLLKTFPELVRVLTVERWSPVHACCITSRAAILDLLLRYSYPDRVLNKYRDPSGQYQYRLPFNINSRDMEGQTPLYQACCVGSAKLVDILVKFRVKAEKVEVEDSSQSAEETVSQSSPQANTVAISIAETGCSGPRIESCTPASSQIQASSSSETQVKRRISDGIQALMSRLNLGREAATGSSSAACRQDGISVSPVHLDMYCNNNAETALHAAVRSKQHSIASLLLSAGADPNLSMYLTAEAEQESIEQSMVFTGSSALVEACRNRDLPMIDLLLKHGARDDLCKALYVACRGTDPVIVSRLLALKAHTDPDYKVHPRGSPTGCERAVPPPVAVMVNWHGHRCLQQLRVGWLLDAVQRVHSAVQLSRQLPRQPAASSALLANVTRLDVSNNSLSELPECVFQLWSLRHLSVAQNKLERILVPADCDPASTLPVLEELYLQENRLEDVPPILFGLLRLTHLDLSNNKLQQLPHQMWTSPALKELNVSLNMLQDLPLMPGEEQSDSEPMVTPACAQEPDSESTLLLADRDGSDVDVDKESALTSAGKKERLPRSAYSRAALPKHPAISSLGVGRQLRSVSEERVRNPNRHLKAAASHRHRSQSRHRVLAGSSDSNSASVGLSLLSPAFLMTSTTTSADIDDHWESLRRDGSPARALHRAQMVSSALTVGKRRRELQHHSVWRGRVEISDACTTLVEVQGAGSKPSQLQSLSLAHNRFSRLPIGLGCLAVSLTRLNLAYNGLTDLASVCDFPATLRQLDASHNRIARWPEPAAIYTRSSRLTVASSADSRRCYASNTNAADGSGSDCSDSVAVRRGCSHRRHTRFDALRSLCLADNQLTDIQLGELPDDRTAHAPVHATSSAQSRRRLESPVRQMFPGLSVLDLSNNCLRSVPPSVHQLSGLSVLNISGNREVVELPPQMGLLSRLWNLNTSGCSLQEPLKTMIESNKYKTMDVIGYLKSVLEDARPYARMKLMIVGVQGIGKTSLLEELRQEGTGTYKKRPPEHWAKRMGNKNMNLRTPSGTTLSTVGVDICDWTYDKRGRGHGSLGPVTFRTWDFGGQREYYATHQYFLSRRSIYLVVWRIPDGEKGVNNIHQWLVNIQARAPNSPVIIVGTHFDIIKDKYPSSYYEDLQQMIRSRFMNLVDADKCGLPRVLDTIEVSCRTRHNIRLLCNLIYESVFCLKSPGSKERLLEQKIPATYLALEDVVSVLAAERHFQGRDPVLTGDQYRTLVGREMSGRFSLGFRDAAELNQATAFLHENGVLLHYDDATLKDLYFLDPQWLCDMLAHVVTVREINPFARNGVMRMEDLSLVFKSSTCAPADARSYVISLLDKFEVAVTWDSRTLLIPSLLPSEEMLRGGAGPAGTADVRIPVRSRGWALRKRSQSQSTLLSDDSNTAAAKSHQSSSNTSDGAGCSVSRRADPAASVRRLYLMTYFPSGFWSRLVTRLLADDVIVDVIRAYFVVPRQVQQDAVLSSVLGGPAEWRCWQSGMELRYADTTLLRVRELLGYLRYTPDYRSTKLLVYQEVQWQEVQTSGGAILEITLPNEALVLRRVPPPRDTDDLAAFGIQSAVLDPSSECAAKLLSIAVEHVDTLLEDWYPTLGTRFAHTSEGRLLVTRLIPCPLCLSPVGQTCHAGDDLDHNLGSHLADHEQTQHPNNDSASYGRFQQPQGPREGNMCGFEVLQAEVSPCATLALSTFQHAAGIEAALTAADHSDGDSGVGPDSACSSRQASTQGHPDPCPAAPSPPPPASTPPPLPPTVYSFLVEECVLESCSCRHVSCPEHGPLLLAQIAPDTVFLDVGERYLIRPDSVQIGPMLGRGAFGFVFRASHRCRTDGRYLDVAMKMLQPSDPGNEARPSAIAAYKAARSKWDRDPLQYACKAYCTVRQELNILLTLRHPCIVPLVGLCLSPLSLVLELAPLGSLDSALADYRRSGARLHSSSMQDILLQVAKALEYLHQQHIIYRDLKSENVLVWSLPPPFRQRRADNTTAVRSTNGDSTHVKLADYGISRSTLPVGTKGFAGTEGFMAPEIMRYNGEEEYTEKVDCFSFGMFIYELVTLHQPFEGFESVKEHILEGRRPPLTAKDVQCATYLLDLMVLCWSQQPRARPCASQIVSMATAPELTQLTSAVPLEQPYNVEAAVSLTNADGGGTVWVARAGCVLDVLHVSDQHQVNEYHSVALQYPAVAAAVVAADVWIGDTRGVVRAFCSETCEEIFSYSLEPDISGEPSAVQDICPLTDMDRVAISLANGRLFITRSDMVPNSPTRGEGSFVMTELGTLGPLNCLSAVFTADRTRCEVWCGLSQGAISIYTLQDQVVVSQDVINHYHPPIPSINVLNILSPEQTQVDCALEDSMWTYVHPGCVVYHWSVTERAVVNKLDCSRLVPVSESMVSMCIEDQLSPGKCQVTAMAVLDSELYLGTTWGCLLVIAAASMLPITVFRPYEEQVRSIIPLARGWQAGGCPAPALVTLGRGYRPLLARYCTVPSDPLQEVTSRRCAFLLVWQPHGWVSR